MFVSGLLGADHDVTAFECGHPSLDEWLRQQALRAQNQDTARTYVWTDEADRAVVAFYSIAPTHVTATSISRGMSGGHSVVPAFLLARLALTQEIQGQGLGGQLLRDALEVCARASAAGAGRLVVVDPIDDAAREFYEHFGFSNTRADERMVIKIATIRARLGLSQA